MSNKQQSKRHSRKNVIRDFEQHFTLSRLEYNKRVKPGKAMAKIVGLIVAAVIYIGGFSLTYISWSRGFIDSIFLNKIAFILMIPASVIGMFAFLISSNRREFPIREDIRAHVRDFEGEDGYLWRYEPILKQLTLKKIDIEWLIEKSRENQLIEQAPEDICTTILALHETLLNSQQISGSAIQQVEKNLNGDNQAAA